MSGHSKWQQIRRKKEIIDKKRAKLFTRLTKDIASAAQAGKDPARNPALREAISRASQAGLPKSNIDRLLHQARQDNHQSVTYEAFGPGGVALLITAKTTNPNRTVADIRTILKNHGSRLSNPGSVRWKFKPEIIATLPKPALTAADQEGLTALIQNLRTHPDITDIATDLR